MSGFRPLADAVVDAYLGRLGCAARTPSADSLIELHAAHVEQVPYETTWIHLGESRTTDPHESAVTIARHGRGGYCYHLNGAFGALLHTLGYQVQPWIGGVHADAIDLDDRGNHLALVVDGLDGRDSPYPEAGRWYVDVGLGDALHRPMVLVPGAVRQGPLTFALERHDEPDACWRFVHDAGGAFGSMSFARPAPDLDWFMPHHRRLSTDPESPFVRRVTVQRRTADSLEAVVGRRWRRRQSGQLDERTIEDRDEWFAVVAGLRLDLDDLTPPLRDRLWQATAPPS